MNTLSRLRRLSDIANQATIALCAAILLIMLTISALGITMEALHAISAGFDAESYFETGLAGWIRANTQPSFVRLFLPWLGMLSISVAFKYGEHIAIIVLARMLPRPAFLLVQAMNLSAIGLFGLALTWYGLEFLVNATHVYIVSDTIQISQRWSAAAVPVAGLLVCLHLFDGLALIERSASADALEAIAIDGAPDKVGASSRRLETGR